MSEKNDMLGREVRVDYGGGDVYDCFVSGYDRAVGITLTLCDSEKRPEWWADDNALCVNKEYLPPSGMGRYDEVFDNFTEAILQGYISPRFEEEGTGPGGTQAACGFE